MKNFIVDQQLLETIAQYLVSKPMIEVEPMVHRMRQLKEHVPAKEMSEPKK